MMTDLKQQMARYAELTVRVGLNVQPGQTVILRGTPIACVDFVRLVAEKAYDAGARRVYVDWEDDQLHRLTFQRADVEALGEVPTGVRQWLEEAAEQNAAFLTVLAPNPHLLEGIEPARISTAQTSRMKAMAHLSSYSANMRVNWCVVAVPTPTWAAKVFPDKPAHEQMDALWQHVLHAVRATENPVQAWEEHLDRLGERTNFLNTRRFKRLHYRGPGTQLTVDLPEGHIWVSGAANKNTRTDVPFVPNVPTEEIFTAPVRGGVNGTVRSTRPLNHNGNLINNFSLTFEQGRLVAYTAETGQDVLRRLIETDEGAQFLGEVALVPVDSPICQLGTQFYNTLFDENASCHFALGRAYPICVADGAKKNWDELKQAGLNYSLTHVDFMMGSPELDIDGETSTGELVPLFRQGVWAR